MRRVLLLLELTGALLVIGSIFFEQHWTKYHSAHQVIGEENGAVALATVVVIALITAAAIRQGLVLGVLAGLAAFFGGIVAAGALVVVHLMMEVTRNVAGDVAVLGCLALSAIGAVVCVVEVVLRVKQRRDDVRAIEPHLPKAIVVT